MTQLDLNQRSSPLFITLSLALMSSVAWTQETVAPAQPVDPAAPLVESGDAPSATPPPISKPADDGATLLPGQPQLPKSDDSLLLPTETSPEATSPGNSGATSSGTDAAKPVGELVSPMMSDGASPPPPVPPMMNTSKAIQFSLDVQGVYDNNIFFSSKDPVSDYIFVASPKMTLQRGDFRAKEESYGILNYNPRAIFFAQGKETNTLEQTLKIETQYAIARLAVGMDASYQRLSGATPDLGDRVDRNVTGAKLRLSYGWGAKMEAETNFLYTGMNYDPAQLADFSEFVNETFLRYQISARTKVALGAGLGRLIVDGFGHQDFERALVQVTSDVGSKLTLRAKGGVEFRQTEMGNTTAPIFSIAMDYKLREGTSFSLEAFREISASGGQPGDNITRTGLVAKVRQKVGAKFTAGLDAGYEQLGYNAADRKTASNQSKTGDRSDDYFFLRPSVQYELKEGRRFEVYYMHRQNDSNMSGSSFEGDQLGISAGIDF